MLANVDIIDGRHGGFQFETETAIPQHSAKVEREVPFLAQ
jgi:hypothetical protein